MKTRSFLVAFVILALGVPFAGATQADDTTITVNEQIAGATPFISQLTLLASDTTVIKSVQFTVTPRPRSVTRPLNGTYSHEYLETRGYLLPATGQIFLPVFGLYDDYTNTVTLTYHFLDGSSKQDSVTIATTRFDDQGCGYKNPTIVQARTPTTTLSYDYIFIRSGCGDFSPVILDTDRYLRWVSTFATPNALFAASTFFNGAAYVTLSATLSRVDLDGTITQIADYTDIGITNLHHNIDAGKTGIIIEADTNDSFESGAYYESIFLEVDPLTGSVLKSWNMADIISDAMTAGGDDPSQFVAPAPGDWFHHNAVTYNRVDDTLLVSSRENFVICIDYETKAIKWILGDKTKKWFQFPSLARYALDLDSEGLPPIGQHAVSVTFDLGLLLFDNGFNSLYQDPPGVLRPYSSPRKYRLDLETVGGTTGSLGMATEVWNFERNQAINSPFCSSVYEDAPYNYLIDYAIIGGFANPNPTAQLLGLDAAGNTIFNYEFPTTACNTAYNSLPIHLEKANFPVVGPRALNLSTRGTVASGDEALIGGFIITGTGSKQVVLRAIGPSLADSGVPGVLANPVLTLFDASGQLVATNDDWQSDPGATEIAANGLAPTDPAEAATIQTLAAGAYTFVVSGQDTSTGIGLVEAYDLSPLADSRLGNLSTRGTVGTGDGVLISGFIVGDVASNAVAIRALGPSLADAGIADPLSDPMLTVYDSNGVALASNDNWQDDLSAPQVEKNGLAPSDPAEASAILYLPAGSYTTILAGVDGGTGTGLLEIYDL
ncbi:MAG: aryl-sulfate sulfotransferase [Verrucomicrobiota bacterium]|nr:aryl-sulfate sulfotransferase [Verrucomicrobiota bacterium]